MIGPVIRSEGGHRVQADVDGRAIWFACDEETLCADAVSYASALMVPALHAGRAVVTEGGLCPLWRAGMGELQAILHEWWGYPELPPTSRRPDHDPPHRASGRTLLFSCGVDSFYSLLAGDVAPDRLLFVHGYDVALTDGARAAAVAAGVRTVAREVGARAVVLRTNLREHPLSEAASWERAHGGALAAAAHLLADHVGEAHVSATYARDRSPPWGSHWRTDRLWSTRRLAVVHTGGEKRRAEKLLAIADQPLVRRHLRVCWRNEGDAMNCSRCDKCLLTMLVLDHAGVLGAFRLFDPPRSLSRALAALPSTRYVRTLAGLLEQELPSPLRRALVGLQRRTLKARVVP